MNSQYHSSNDKPKNGQTDPAVETFCACGSHSSLPRQDSSRRRFLQMTLGGTAAGIATVSGMEFVTPTRVSAQSMLSPDAALQELMDGNKRFTAARLTACEHDLAILKEHTIEKQEPFAAVLSCADSRVPIELVFDQSIGHIFVTRIAGNIATSEIIASLEYGAGVLGTKVILVMGHVVAARSRLPFKPRKSLARSAPSIRIYSLRLIKRDQISKQQPRQMPRSRQAFCANPRRLFRLW
jgi:hypothetical protein